MYTFRKVEDSRKILFKDLALSDNQAVILNPPEICHQKFKARYY